MDEKDRALPFAVEDRYARVARLFGIDASRASIELDDDGFTARLGPWSVRTGWENVAGATVTGPYSVLKTIGPPHLGLGRDLTFATTSAGGVEIRFHRPVPGIEPLGLLRHPSLTVTVEDPEGFAVEIDDRRRDTGLPVEETAAADPAPAPGTEEGREEEAAEDDLHTMTASQLRDLAEERGLRNRSSMNKSQLVALLEADMGDDIVEAMEDVPTD